MHRLDYAFPNFGVPGALWSSYFQFFTSVETALVAMVGVIAGSKSGLQVTFYLLCDDPVGGIYRPFGRTSQRRRRDAVHSG